MLKVLLFLWPLLWEAQNYRFTYRYDHLLDSTQPSTLQQEMIRLDVEGSHSFYYAYTDYRNDSLIQAQKNNYSAGNIPYKNIVEKDNGKVTLYTRFINDFYKIPDDRVLSWAIGKETSEVAGYKVQKATVNFAGRHWTAWFTDEIPIPDGPYKFHGLPGLIVKIADEGDLHQIELIGVQKIQTGFKLANQAFIQTTREKYRQLYQQNSADPFEALRKTGIDPKMISTVTVNGKPVNVQEFLKSGKLGFSPDPNPIELNL